MKHVKHLLLSTILGTALLSLSSTSAQAANAANPSNDQWANWYAGLSGDLTWPNRSRMGGGGNVALGARFWPSTFGDFRLEGEAGYHGAHGDSSHSSTHYFTYMGNMYYDLNGFQPFGSRVVPYIGAGIGDAAVHYGNNNNSFTSTFHHHDNVFAYQGMAGLTYVAASMPNIDWSLGYRYLGTGDDNRLHANNAELGMRYHF